MKHIKDIINLEVPQNNPAERRKKLAYEVAQYFNEPTYLWFRYFADSGVYTSFLELYFKESKSANKPKKTQAKFFMKKLFPNGKNML